MGAARPFFLDDGNRIVGRGQMATGVHDKERTLYRQVAQQVEAGHPGVEVLALELTGRERFRVYVDHPAGVDHALCAQVTSILRPYLDEYSVEVSSPRLRPAAAHARTLRACRRPPGAAARPPTGAFAARSSRRASASLRLEQRTGEPLEIAYDEIVRANLIDEG